jgi:S-adenosyl-L-methionine hydrolase (adenosine-forming)
MKGVIAMRAPGVVVVDLSHGIPPQNVLAGALVLRAAAPYFPPKTVHVAVVDPGVGSERRAICIETAEAVFVGPDNGVLSLAAPPDRALRTVAIADERFMLSPRSRTFHGRDVFAPAAAAVATGTSVCALGPALDDVHQLDLAVPTHDGTSVLGQVTYVDRFGNLATNIDAALIPARVDRVEIGNGRRRIPLLETYASTKPGSPLALLNSWGVLEIAVRDGDARVTLGLDVGAPVRIVGA